jgi:hypothetical protein
MLAALNAGDPLMVLGSVRAVSRGLRDKASEPDA